MAEYRERLLAKATLLVDNVKEILSNVSSKEALISTTETTVMTARELAEEMKAGSASLGTDLQEAQVEKMGPTPTRASLAIRPGAATASTWSG